MKSFHFGQIVLIGFPHTDGTSINKRPALVLLDTNDEDIIVCRITSKLCNTAYDIESGCKKNHGINGAGFVMEIIRILAYGVFRNRSIS